MGPPSPGRLGPDLQLSAATISSCRTMTSRRRYRRTARRAGCDAGAILLELVRPTVPQPIARACLLQHREELVRRSMPQLIRAEFLNQDMIPIPSLGESKGLYQMMEADHYSYSAEFTGDAVMKTTDSEYVEAAVVAPTSEGIHALLMPPCCRYDGRACSRKELRDTKTADVTKHVATPQMSLRVNIINRTFLVRHYEEQAEVLPPPVPLKVSFTKLWEALIAIQVQVLNTPEYVADIRPPEGYTFFEMKKIVAKGIELAFLLKLANGRIGVRSLVQVNLT